MEPKNLKERYYAIGKKISQVYGHGDNGQEIHICPINAYIGNDRFHPLFTSPHKAQEYIDKLKWNHDYVVVELEVSL